MGVDPSKCQGQELATPRLYIFDLAIQDHIEFLRKANTIKMGWGIGTCELRWDFPEEEGMMQYNRDKYFPQLWNQGLIDQYETKNGTKVEVETCTTQPNYFAPTGQWGCQSHWSC